MQFRSLLEPRSQTRSERHAFATERVRIGEEGLEQQIPREIISTIERKKTWNRETSREINYLYARRTTTISAMMDRNFAPRLCSKSHHIFSSSRIIKGRWTIRLIEMMENAVRRCSMHWKNNARHAVAARNGLLNIKYAQSFSLPRIRNGRSHEIIKLHHRLNWILTPLLFPTYFGVYAFAISISPTQFMREKVKLSFLSLWIGRGGRLKETTKWNYTRAICETN